MQGSSQGGGACCHCTAGASADHGPPSAWWCLLVKISIVHLLLFHVDSERIDLPVSLAHDTGAQGVSAVWLLRAQRPCGGRSWGLERDQTTQPPWAKARHFPLYPLKSLRASTECDGFTTTHQRPSTYRESGCDPSPPWTCSTLPTHVTSGFCCAVRDTHPLADVSRLWVFTHDLLLHGKDPPHSIYLVRPHLTFRGSGPFSREALLTSRG